MLFTRCPDCKTNFRITADALRIADGEVQCGRCSAVFNAYAKLQEGPDATISADTAASTTAPMVEPGAEDLSPTDEFPPLQETSLVGDDEAPSDPPPEGRAAAQQRAVPEPEHFEAPESSLEFDLPKDEWTSFFEQVVEESSNPASPPDAALRTEVEESLTGAPQDMNPARPHAEEPRVGQIVEDTEVGWEPDADLGPEPSGPDLPRGAAALEMRELEELAGELAAAQHVAEVESSTESSAELAALITPQAIDATLSAEPASDSAAFSMDRLHGLLGRPPAIPLRWGIGSSVLLMVLALQAIHHFRAALASQSLVGPLLQAAYTQAGVELTPSWDLSQYEIMDWVATAERSANGRDTLRITARIHNRGPAAQPYPSVHLELKDRWEEPVGSRVFLPSEYLQADVGQDRLMAADTTVPARLEVVDPGQDAYGFELDVCVEVGEGGLSCASDRVFQ